MQTKQRGHKDPVEIRDQVETGGENKRDTVLTKEFLFPYFSLL